MRLAVLIFLSVTSLYHSISNAFRSSEKILSFEFFATFIMVSLIYSLIIFVIDRKLLSWVRKEGG